MPYSKPQALPGMSHPIAFSFSLEGSRKSTNSILFPHTNKWGSKFQRTGIVSAKKMHNGWGPRTLNSPWLGDHKLGSSTCQATCLSLSQAIPSSQSQRQALGIFTLDQETWIADIKWGWADSCDALDSHTLTPIHSGHTCVHAVGDSLGLWLLQNDLAMTMTLYLYGGKKAYLHINWYMYKRIYIYTHINTQLGNSWNDTRHCQQRLPL